MSGALAEPTTLYDADSPAPRCLRMFLLEKGLSVPSVTIDVFSGENRRAPFLGLNPAGQTPALALRDGTVLAESVAIAEYLEECHPYPALIGATALEPLSRINHRFYQWFPISTFRKTFLFGKNSKWNRKHQYLSGI